MSLLCPVHLFLFSTTVLSLLVQDLERPPCQFSIALVSRSNVQVKTSCFCCVPFWTRSKLLQNGIILRNSTVREYTRPWRKYSWSQSSLPETLPQRKYSFLSNHQSWAKFWTRYEVINPCIACSHFLSYFLFVVHFPCQYQWFSSPCIYFLTASSSSA